MTKNGGKVIQNHERALTRFPSVRLQPLGHLSLIPTPCLSLKHQ